MTVTETGTKIIRLLGRPQTRKSRLWGLFMICFGQDKNIEIIAVNRPNTGNYQQITIEIVF